MEDTPLYNRLSEVINNKVSEAEETSRTGRTKYVYGVDDSTWIHMEIHFVEGKEVSRKTFLRDGNGGEFSL